MSEERIVCRTVLLDDAPATEDAFGPHKRIADAIFSLVNSEPGGRAIGLEGGWGAGKSTVVSFVRSALRANNRFRVITFDAWAHEGDPLRRTYLETVVGELKEASWVDSKAWDKTLDELANRRKTTTTRITPKPTWLGALFAISLVLVPIGTALVTATFRQGAPGDISDFRKWPWIAFVGGLIALMPFWVLLGNLIRWWWRGKHRSADDWTFLVGRAIEETRTDTSESVNPTSIEFEEHFTRAMKEALGTDHKRRLVLVLDNLDRVDTNSAISVWSTLQTFLQERNSLNSAWFKQIWVIVPYDPAGLRKLWDNWRAISLGGAEDADNGSTNSQNQRMASDSFIDKSFQIRFQVPPPVLSDWKTYLCRLLEIALPDHGDADRHAIYRVYEEWRSTQSIPPTPRELKLFVNQIGAVHRQWLHEFPIGHVAYYVLLSRQGDFLIEQLKSQEFPPTNMRRLFKEDIIPSLAGLTFNVPANKGMEFLLSDPIYSCLTEGSGDKLDELLDKHQDGFWTVAERVMETRIIDAPSSAKAHAGHVVFHSRVLEDGERIEANRIRKGLRDAITSVLDWQPFDTDTAEGVSAIQRLFNERELSACVLESIRSSISNSEVGDKKVDAAVIPLALLEVLRTATDLGFEDAIPQSFTLPGDVDSWMTTCEALCGQSADEQYLKRFMPKDKVDAIATAIQTAVAAGKFSERHIAALHVTTQSVENSDWSGVVSEVQTRLDASAGAGADEMRPLLRGLWVLRNLGNGRAAKSLKKLVTEGHIAHHLHQSAKHKEGIALCQFTILYEDPTATTPPAVGNSATGHQQLINSLASSDKEAAKNFCDTIQKYGHISKLFEIIEARGSCDPLLGACLQTIAEGGAPQELFTGEVVLKRWTQIQEALASDGEDRPFDQLIKRLADDHQLCKVVQENERGFEPKDAVLYWTIVLSAQQDHSTFYIWCKVGLEGLSKDSWLSDLNETNDCVWLACVLSDKNVRVKLTTHFADALEEHAKMAIKGEKVPEDAVLTRWHDLLELLDDSTRKALDARLLTLAINADGQLSGEFLTMYGNTIGEPEILASNSRSVVGLFSPVVRKRLIPGLRWLVDFLAKNGEFLNEASANDNVDEFRRRLQDCVNQPEEDDAQIHINELAELLGIVATTADVELDGAGDE